MQKILIIDPECRELSGHCYPTTKSLLDTLQDTERFVSVHRKASPLIRFEDDVTAWRWPDVRTLTGRAFRQVARTARYRAILRARDANAMLQFTRRAKLGAGDAIIMHTAWPYHANSLAILARKLQQRNGPDLHIRIIGECQREQFKTEDETGLAHLAAAAHQIPKLHVYTETVELGAKLENSYRFPALRQWLTPMNFHQTDSPAEKTDPRDCLVVGMLGGKRKEQGIELIPDIIQLLAQRQRQAGLNRIRILMQKPAGIVSASGEFDEAARFLASLRNLGLHGPLEIELLDSELDASAFTEAICQSHVLLLPYDIQSYRGRGSGLIIEGAMCGTPVVVTKGFSMSDWQELAGSPTASSIAEYVDAVLAVARDYPRYRDGATRAGHAMRQAMKERIAEIRSGGG